jgi:hypothetical protein
MALLVGQLVFMGVVIFLLSQGDMGTGPNEVTGVLVSMSFGLLFVLTPIGYLIRRMIFKRYRDRPVPPQTYIQAIVTQLATCEFVGLFGLVALLIHQRYFPVILSTLIAMAVQVKNYPHGRELRPVDTPYTPISPA